MKCDECGTTEGVLRDSKKYEKILCSKCYQLYQYHKGAMVHHKLPAKGVIELDEDGLPICHICGLAIKKLMSHVRQRHNMTAYEYKIKFGLYTGKGIMSNSSTMLARKRNLENYNSVVTENLLKKGTATRFSLGATGRLKTSVSLQELKRIRLMNRTRVPKTVQK